jgi:hypothetical protein
MYETRQYVIFNTTELDNINFDEVLETSADTVRKSTDESQTFVKWQGEVPACVESLTTKGSYLTHEEILETLSTSDWTQPMQME